MASASELRLLVITLEFLGPVFSGNGQYCRAIVRALKAQGARVMVVSGRKGDVGMPAQDEEGRAHAADPRHGVVDVPLDMWQRLDRSSGWAQLAAGCATPSAVAAVTSFAPHAALLVDWTAIPAWLALKAALAAASPAPSPPSIYLNFRVFSSSFCTDEGGVDEGSRDIPDPGAGGGGAAALDALSERLFYCAMEGAAVRACTAAVALCRSDALVLTALAAGDDPLAPAPGKRLWASGCGADAAGRAWAAAAAGGAGSAPLMRIIMPPLREAIRALAIAPKESVELSGGAAVPGSAFSLASLPGYRHITCAVRLSSEKGPHRFGPLLTCLDEACPGLLDTCNLQPLVCGNGPDAAYVAAVHGLVKDASERSGGRVPPPVFITTFLGPSEMGTIFASTALNVHTPLADAYGMTIVEAAALGVPSLVHIPSACDAAGGLGGAEGVFGPVPDLPLPGYLCVRPAHLLLPAGSGSVAAAEALGPASLALAASLPPVGACDLLGVHLASDSLPTGGVVPVDLSATPAEQAAQLLPWLKGGRALADVAERARGRALAWTERDNGSALLHLLREVRGL
jgi:hypothetical protein